MVIWFAVVVVFFSLPRSKLIGYVLPALAPLAYLIARRLCAGRPAGQLRGRVRATAVAAAALCIAVVGTIVAMGAPPAARLRLPAGLTVGPMRHASIRRVPPTRWSSALGWRRCSASPARRG